MIKIRELTKEDVGSFRRVRLLGLQESPTAFGASYAQEEKMPVEELTKRVVCTTDRWVLGAFSGDELIGVVGFIRESGEKSRHKGFIWGMYVVPEFRRKGVGRALFQEALSRIDTIAGLRKVVLSVVTTNSAAIRLYAEYGFVAYGEEVDALCVDGAYYAEFHMFRTIRQEPNEHV